jgi:hypothetical protein
MKCRMLMISSVVAGIWVSACAAAKPALAQSQEECGQVRETPG